MGRLLGIAKAHELLAPLELVEDADVSVERGIEGDARGAKPTRQVTILFRKGWEDACRELGVTLPWTTRRANLYVEGIECPRRTGDHLRIGDVVLLVTKETDPCNLMEQFHTGLRKALTPEWRGGVCCSVVSGREIKVGDGVEFAAV